MPRRAAEWLIIGDFGGALHTLHNEINREEIFQTVRKWMEDVLELRNAAAG